MQNIHVSLFNETIVYSLQKTILIHPSFGLMTSVCKGINYSKGCIKLVGEIIGVNPCFEVILFSLSSRLLKGLFDGC